jgi:adenylyltransferase/sulfurtransferase
VLFDERDAAQSLPKAIAAAQRLGAINSTIRIEPRVIDVNAGNIEQLLLLEGTDGAPRTIDLIVDGTDNAATRYLINDVATKHRIPWIYGACVGTEGRAMAILPGRGPCLRCLYPQPPAPGELPTCDTVGVLGAAAGVVGSLQSTAALKILSGHTEAIEAHLWTLDLWLDRIHALKVAAARRADCPCCGQRRFDLLDARSDQAPTSLCGRDAVQVLPGRGSTVDLDRLSRQLSAVGHVERTPYLVRCALHAPESLRLTLFPDGRLIVHGTTDPARARSAYAKYIGT